MKDVAIVRRGTASHRLETNEAERLQPGMWVTTDGSGLVRPAGPLDIRLGVVVQLVREDGGGFMFSSAVAAVAGAAAGLVTGDIITARQQAEHTVRDIGARDIDLPE